MHEPGPNIAVGSRREVCVHAHVSLEVCLWENECLLVLGSSVFDTLVCCFC